MAFNTIVVGTKTWNSIGQGAYLLSTVGFNQPLDMFKISAGKKNPKTGFTNAAWTRHVEKDVVRDGKTVRERASLTNQIVVPGSFTTAEVDVLLDEDVDAFTAALLTRLLMGES